MDGKSYRIASSRWQIKMAIGRSAGRARCDTGRDPGGFIALPLSVLDCPNYVALSHPAKNLLIEVARQCKGDNNGRLLLSRAYLAIRGWNSADVIHRAKSELIESGFIFETVMGHRPNKASWYAVTWRRLDKIAGFDIGTDKAFEQGAYKRNVPLLDVKKLRGYQASNDIRPSAVGTALSPPDGTDAPSIGPPPGTESPPPAPSDGAMQGGFRTPPVPSDGHPLEEPSAGVGFAVARPATCAAPPALGKAFAGHKRWAAPPALAAAPSVGQTTSVSMEGSSP